MTESASDVSRAAFVETNVYMVVAAAVYLACKIEECPQHIKIVTAEIQTVWGLGKVSGETQKLAEAEFYLINELDTHLIVHHPYRVLNTFTNLWKGWQRDIDEAWYVTKTLSLESTVETFLGSSSTKATAQISLFSSSLTLLPTRASS